MARLERQPCLCLLDYLAAAYLQFACAALYGLAVALAALHLHHRRRAAAARVEAKLLQAKIDEALRAQVQHPSQPNPQFYHFA